MQLYFAANRSKWVVSLFQIPECRYERVYFLTGVIERERRPHRALHSKTPQDRLCAVMTRANGDALTIQRRAHIFRAEAIEYKGKHARFFARGADQAQPGNLLQAIRGVNEELV